MNLDDTPEEAAYRARARQWLTANAMPKTADRENIGGNIAGPEQLAIARNWQATKAAAGYACITWPKDWGGAGGSAIQQVIFNQEETTFDVPTGFFSIGLGMCMPTLIKVGDETMRRRFVGPAVRGEEIWCQLFSEPAAGSDLAGIRTRATRDHTRVVGEGGSTAAGAAGHWVVNGQKVWTSGAHYSDFGMLLARTDPTVPKHKGLTMFWIDMKAPGVRVQPIHQASGGAEFNEVFFDGLRIDDAQRLGAVGEGFKVALVTLMNERVAGSRDRGLDIEDVIAFARSLPRGSGSLLDDASFRRRLADWYVSAAGLRYTRFRVTSALSRGEVPGPEAAIGKLLAASRVQEMTGELIESLEEYGLIDGVDTPLGGALHREYLQAAGTRIAGGTDEILRNTIAERVLGMPGEIRVDKEVAFQELVGGA